MTDKETRDAAFDLIRQIKRHLWGITIATICLYIVMGVGAYFTISRANQINDSFCDFRADLQARVQRAREFLSANPEGFNLGAIRVEPGQLKLQIESQKRTIESLRDLECE